MQGVNRSCRGNIHTHNNSLTTAVCRIGKNIFWISSDKSA